MFFKSKYDSFPGTRSIKIDNYNSELEIQHMEQPKLGFIAQVTMASSEIIKSKQAQQYNQAFKGEICPQFKCNKRSICFRSVGLKILLDDLKIRCWTVHACLCVSLTYPISQLSAHKSVFASTYMKV